MASIIQKGARVQTLANVNQTPAPIVSCDLEISVESEPLEVELLGTLEIFFECATGDFVATATEQFSIKRHDRRPVLRVLIKDAETGLAFDLSGVSSAKFLMADRDGTVVVDQAAAVEAPATDGVLRYDWQAGDTGTAGVYRGEFEMDFGGGDKLTVPNQGFISIRVYEDLDDA